MQVDCGDDGAIATDMFIRLSAELEAIREALGGEDVDLNKKVEDTSREEEMVRKGDLPVERPPRVLGVEKVTEDQSGPPVVQEMPESGAQGE